jgi:hypothetical protein
VTVLAQQALQMQRDLPVASGDDDVHGVLLPAAP